MSVRKPIPQVHPTKRLSLPPIMKLTLDCRALARLLSQSQEDAPPLVSRARMRLHLMTCQRCRSVDEQMRFIRTAMRQLQINAPANASATEPPQ